MLLRTSNPNNIAWAVLIDGLLWGAGTKMCAWNFSASWKKIKSLEVLK
jgi:hypothetical protein